MTEKMMNSFRYYSRRHSQRSPRRAERDLRITFSTVRKISRTLILIFPYKITRAQHERDNEKITRVTFAEWCKVNISNDSNFLHRIAFSDECVFHESEIANT